MECPVYTKVSMDNSHLYIYRQNEILQFNPVPTSVYRPTTGILQFIYRDDHKYLLDTNHQLWSETKLIASQIQECNEQYVLSQNGTVWTWDGKLVPLPFLVIRLCQELILSSDYKLYDRNGLFLASDVVDAHSDNDDIIIVHQNGLLEFIGENGIPPMLEPILQTKDVRKAVINQGSVLLLLHDGTLIASGANLHCECGVEELPVSIPREFNLPPVIDFGYENYIGWALLATNQVVVWGYNDPKGLFFYQWASESFISPRLLSF